MLKTFLQRIIKAFTNYQQSDLEAYVVSRYPKHAGDIDKIVFDYYTKQSKGYGL